RIAGLNPVLVTWYPFACRHGRPSSLGGAARPRLPASAAARVVLVPRAGGTGGSILPRPHAGRAELRQRDGETSRSEPQRGGPGSLGEVAVLQPSTRAGARRACSVVSRIACVNNRGIFNTTQSMVAVLVPFLRDGHKPGSPSPVGRGAGIGGRPSPATPWSKDLGSS